MHRARGIGCGYRGLTEMKEIEDVFAKRVDEFEVARILQLMSQVPNRRDKARPGDVSGDFDFWFDGGACRIQTGQKEFVFENGIKATLAAPVPSLHLTIDFPDGRGVEVRQRR